MKIIDIINGPWAIQPEMLHEIRSIYAKHLRGEKINIADIEAKIGQPLKREEQGYEVINGAAVIPVDGVIAKKMNLFSRISGGASTQLIERDIRQALDDPMVQKIILSIDSPGGTIDGTFELADFIFQSRGKKPIIAHTDGMMLSAAYAIGSAADEIYISGNTTFVGSIGVVAAHEDISKWEEQMGVKTTEIYSGKYKRITSQYSPLSKEGKKSMQDDVDYLYSAFIETVALHRGTNADDVLSQMSTDVKPYFIGLQAVEAGLVDGVATLDQLINNAGGATGMQYRTGKPAGDAGQIKKEESMTKEELKAKHPEIYKAIYDEGFKAGEEKGQDEMECSEQCLQKGRDEGKKEGAAAELARIKGIKAISVPGHETLVETLMFDGTTTPEQAAVKILAAEKVLKDARLDQYRSDGKDIKVPVVDGGEPKPKKPEADASLPVEERAKKAWDEDPNIRMEFGSYNVYLAYEKARGAGQVRILKGKSE